MTSSSTRNFCVVGLAVMIACINFADHCHAWSLAAQPVDGILLLKNSNILRGKLQKQGKHYFVFLPNGKLRVRENQVETVCQDIQAAFEYRKHKYGGTSADSRLDLVAWCLRHELYEHAESELQAVESMDAKHPRLKFLRRQLTQTLKMVELHEQQRIAEAKVVPDPEPIDPAKLDKAPKWARALFVRQIQPLMVQSCTAGGCHQSSTESEFQLSKLAIDGVGHPGVTLRNLSETLEEINWDAAEQSDLLVQARRAHGATDSSTPLPPHKLHVLQSWVSQLAEANDQSLQLKELPAVVEVAEVPITPTLQLNAPQLEPSKPAEGVRTASYEPKDPFDPAVFNDRYATAKPAPDIPNVAPQVQPADSVPHVLAPSDPAPIPLPPTE